MLTDISSLSHHIVCECVCGLTLRYILQQLLKVSVEVQNRENINFDADLEQDWFKLGKLIHCIHHIFRAVAKAELSGETDWSKHIYKWENLRWASNIPICLLEANVKVCLNIF